MRRWLGWIAIGWLLAICAVALLAYGSPTAHASLSERTRQVAQGLRCPVCQGESVADSPAGLARAMRAEIRQRLAAGQTPAQIDRYFVAKYGDWILLSPPDTGVGTLAWLAPPLLLVGGIGLLATLVFDWRKGGRRRAVAGEPDEYLARVRAELARDEETEVAHGSS